jgi:hypothetical protein
MLPSVTGSRLRFDNHGAVSIKTNQTSNPSLPERPVPREGPHFIGMGAHLHESLLHRLSRRAGCQMFNRGGQRPDDVFYLLSSHVTRSPAQPRLGPNAFGPETFGRKMAGIHSEQRAAPRRKGCHRPQTS